MGCINDGCDVLCQAMLIKNTNFAFGKLDLCVQTFYIRKGFIRLTVIIGRYNLTITRWEIPSACICRRWNGEHKKRNSETIKI